MKKPVVVLLCLLFCSHPAAAQEKRNESREPLLAEKECRYLTAYQPSPDNNADYKPGVDVRGKPVVGADITPPVIQPPEKYSFNLTVDMAKYIGLTAPTGVEGKTRIGTITVEKGQLRFNGNPLEGDAAAALRALCLAQKPK